ncbi:hypothetical protein KGM_215110 [Danaus plexippus plexippus]|uniref:Vitellogenin domain-containing protein n=1 Tax=Danaus plexippus plexippus TaxID=278856 RepID=A0A212EM69_DANPL|nr:hypothetical protein KGM_215110 [Danaus plexippus plexippus]
MIYRCILLFAVLAPASATGIQMLFPDQKQYNYVVKTNISTGVAHRNSYWTLEGRLVVLVDDNYYATVQFKLEDLKTSVYSYNTGFSSYHTPEAARELEEPWKIIYQENGFISAIQHLPHERVWVTNIKRAISVNFQLKKDAGSYTNEEPCLYESCVMVYSVQGNTIKKYNSYQKASMTSQTSWSSVPWSGDYGRGVPENIATSQRVYDLDEKGLNCLNMKGLFEYIVDGHVLTVTTESVEEELQKSNQMGYEELQHELSCEISKYMNCDVSYTLKRLLPGDLKDNIEDATILSLIRKLPFNIANHSQALLEDMETISKLGLDFPQEIRHAGILSFAIMVSHCVEAMKVKQDYFDSILVKYFRMYSDCPQYLDRLIWLQGLCSLGYTSESYIRTIYADKTRNRHERLWASLACGQDTRGYNVLETSLPILMDDNEHIQLRISALHAILSSGIRESDFLFLHSWISTSRPELQRFWYSTVKSLESNKFPKYRTISDYIPFVSKDVVNPDSSLWGTNNYIVSGDELSGWVQVMTVGNPAPTLAALSVSTGGRRAYQASVYIIAEGVQFDKVRKWKQSDLKVDNLLKILERLNVRNLKTSEEVHIDVVIKIQDKTVYATHINQTRFESWNGYDLTKSITEFLRFGSHINQQIAYYPIQIDVNVPSDLGTPIRLQSSVVTFTSLRGNLTSNPDSGLALDWVNDLHIRHQATITTALSTIAPLLQSEHEVRVQRSAVAHLPIKFNVTMEQYAKSIALTWLNPFAQRAGFAIHSWIQVHMDARQPDLYTVSSGITTDDDSGIFFDCERKTSGAEVVEKYIMSKFMSYDLFPTKHILNTISRFITSCGVIIPPNRLVGGEDEMVHVEFTLGDIVFQKVDKIEMEFDFMLKYYSINDPNKQIYLKIDSNTKIKSAGRNLFIKWFLYVNQPYSLDPKKKFWKLCYTQKDTSHAPSDQDITIHPSSYHGTSKILYQTSEEYNQCNPNETRPNESIETKLQLNYKGTPKNNRGTIERYVEVDILGENLHNFDLLHNLGYGVKTPVAQLLGSFDKNKINTTSVIKEKDGIASIRVNGGVEVEMYVGGLSWLLDSWTAMQLMRRFGLYRECRLQESTVQMLSGSVEQLQPLQCSESLVLADCSVSPRFVILRKQDGGIQLYDGDYPSKNATSVHSSKVTDYKSILEVGTKILSESTGVVMYKRLNENVILLPSSYMHSVCGECAGHTTYNNC